MVDDRPLFLRLQQKALLNPAQASPTAGGPALKRKKRPAKDVAEPSKKLKRIAGHTSPSPAAEGGANDIPLTPVIDLSKEDDAAVPAATATKKPTAEHILTKNTGSSRQAVINLPKEGGMLGGPNSLLDAYPRFITRGDKAELDGLPLESLKQKCGRSITDAAIYAFEAFAKYEKEVSDALESEAKALVKEIDAGKALADQRKINTALVTENADIIAKVKKLEDECDAKCAAARQEGELKGRLAGAEEFKKSRDFLPEACKYIKDHIAEFENSEFGEAYTAEATGMSYAFGMYAMQRSIYAQLEARDPLFKPAALGLPKRRKQPTAENYETDYEDSSDEGTETEMGGADDQAVDSQADAETQVAAGQPGAEGVAQEGAQQAQEEEAREKTGDAAQDDGTQQVDVDAQIFSQLGDLA